MFLGSDILLLLVITMACCTCSGLSREPRAAPAITEVEGLPTLGSGDEDGTIVVVSGVPVDDQFRTEQ